MALMPGTVWKPMPGSSTSRMSAYDILCAHTCVGSLDGTDSWFRSQANGLNSHFGVGGDGTIYQWVDTAYRSGANYNGNYHIISVECADMGAPFGPWGGSDVPAWTLQQIAALGRIGAWVHATHGIPLTQIPDAKPGRKGVGYHRLGVPGYMVAGAEQWSKSQGKVCPGDRRIAQIPQVIAAALGGAGEDFIVDDATATRISAIVVNALETPLVDWSGTKNANTSVLQQLRLNAEGVALVYGELHALREAVGQIAGTAGGSAGIDLKAIEEAGRKGAQSALDTLTVTVATDDKA
jgi:hypothetical protein